MTKKSFDIGEFAKTLKTDVSKLGTAGRDQIQYISIDLIDDDPNNFYELSCIDELAANIELCGLQQPIRLRAGEGERYTIVSGHRRRAALLKLVEDGRTEYQEAPCIVEQAGTVSTAMQELRLIYANADTRHLTSAEQSKQAERVAALLYQLKEEGMEFPGRMRDHVAEACKLSKTKLARLKVIREKLIPLWSELYKKDKINEDTAYELAKLSEDYQRKLYEAKQGGGLSLYGNSVETWGKQLAALDAITCPKGDQCCTNAENMWQRMLKQDYVFKNCDGRYCSTAKCCKGCQQLYTCKFACSHFAAQITKHKAETKAQKKEEKTEQKAKEAVHIAAVTASWARFHAARGAAKMTTQFFLKQVYGQDKDRSYMYDSWKAKQWAEKERGEGITDSSRCFADDLSQVDLVRMADVLGCSIDYLLDRVADPQPFTGAWTSVQDESPDEGRFLFVCDAFGCVQPSVFWNGDYKDATPRSVGNETLKHIHYWMYQPAMPDGMKRTGQETLERLMQERECDHEPRDV